MGIGWEWLNNYPPYLGVMGAGGRACSIELTNDDFAARIDPCRFAFGV
jgi:hypothetical protein